MLPWLDNVIVSPWAVMLTGWAVFAVVLLALFRPKR